MNKSKLAWNFDGSGEGMRVEPGTLEDVDTSILDDGPPPLRVLLLCDNSHPANVVQDHIAAFTRYSRNSVFVLNPLWVKRASGLSLDLFDVVVIHYSVMIIDNRNISFELRKKIRDFRGLKVQFIQDEYRSINAITDESARLGIHVLFSAMTPGNISRVYGRTSLGGVKAYSTLSGYVPERLVRFPSPPVGARPYDAVYRGRNLPFWLGSAGQDKEKIVQGFTELAIQHGLRVNLSAEDGERIYGKKWIRFITSGRTVLGTEGGSSVFDFDGEAQQGVEDYLSAHPKACFQEVCDRVLGDLDGRIVHRALTPRIFEAIALRTPMVLFRGEYRGVLRPGEHYISLEKDFSNADDVVRQLREPELLQDMADRAFEEIAMSENYRFRTFARHFDAALAWAINDGSHQAIIPGHAIDLPGHAGRLPPAVGVRLWQMALLFHNAEGRVKVKMAAFLGRAKRTLVPIIRAAVRIAYFWMGRERALEKYRTLRDKCRQFFGV